MAQLEALFRQQHRSLYRYVYQIAGSADDALEIVQETFLRLCKVPNALDISWTDRAYLFNLARNIAIDALRKRKVRHRYAAETTLIYEQPHAGATPEEAILDRERKGIAQAALRQLADRDREVLTLRATGFSYDEISCIMGLHRGSIGQTVSRALRKCRLAYEEQMEASGEEPGHVPARR